MRSGSVNDWPAVGREQKDQMSPGDGRGPFCSLLPQPTMYVGKFAASGKVRAAVISAGEGEIDQACAHITDRATPQRSRSAPRLSLSRDSLQKQPGKRQGVGMALARRWHGARSLCKSRTRQNWKLPYSYSHTKVQCLPSHSLASCKQLRIRGPLSVVAFCLSA